MCWQTRVTSQPGWAGFQHVIPIRKANANDSRGELYLCVR